MFSCIPLDGTLTGMTTLNHAGPGSNGHEEVSQTLRRSRTVASLLDAVLYHIDDTFLVGWVYSSRIPIDGTLIGTTTLNHAGPGSNGHEEVSHTLR